VWVGLQGSSRLHNQGRDGPRAQGKM